MKPAKRIKARQRDATLFDAVLGDPNRQPRRARWREHAVAWLFALGVHLVLLVAANHAEPVLETWSVQMAGLIHEDLAAQSQVTIELPPEPDPVAPPVAEPAGSAPRPAIRREPRAEAVHSPTPPPDRQPAPPAEAGRIVASETEDLGLVDFTDRTFVAGTASVYVGGASARNGTNQTPVPEGAVARNASPSANPGRFSLARPVQLSGNEWRCDWPEAAVARDIYEQFVVLRVVVRAEGTVERVSVVDDPGYGFGAAATVCARRTRFTPARDGNGQSVRATSPPIRVRFTR